VHAHSSLLGIRIVALPAAIDLCIGAIPSSTTALRFAPDEVLLVPELVLGDDEEFDFDLVDSVVEDTEAPQAEAEDLGDLDDDDRLEAALEVLLGEDPAAIVATDTGLSAMMFSRKEYDRLVASRVEWRLPAVTPYLAQGKFLGVPVKLYDTGNEALVICLTAYAHELAERVR
jgi:hypothetical protein